MKYSISTKGFYPSDEISQLPYIEAGTLPDDLIDISDEDYDKFFNPPDGYYSVFDEQGPRLEKIPEPDYVAIAEAQRDSLLAEATTAITVWQTKLLMGRKLTTDETEKLNAWMDYIDVLNDTDLSDAPDVQWPTKPAI
ncbi:tail fiber assembly protein [Mixta mediterraneensis]|uniref:tail fiber assembly protein n=1 Tax=Mixta mediterraneensis TaxID=2758443 RepID=UPI001874FD7A|nr:tail fiber assembly protein [Mixta mediterraneensis]MBE5251829.1 tail fiber assembly protein [Mixta mediterraneensis]